MLNPLTGKPEPNLYSVEIWNGKRLVIEITVKSTNEQEAVAQAVKQLKTIVRKI